MDGKGRDGGGGSGAGQDPGAGWLGRMIAGLEAQAEEALKTMAASTDVSGDVVAADRKAKAITNLARAVRAIEALRPRPGGKTAATSEETMNGDDTDDVDAAEFERARAELERRLDHLCRTFEAKSVDGWPVVQPDAGGDPRPGEAA